MSGTDSWGGMTTIISILFGILFLFIIYILFEAREEDGDGNRIFSPQKLGIMLKNIFGTCCPDAILIFFANLCICCGYVGNSCLDQIQADEEIRETKRLARLAANLSKKAKQKKKKQKAHKIDHDFEAISSSEDEPDLEIGSSHSAESNGSGRREKSRPIKTNQKSPIAYPTHSARTPNQQGLDQNDRSERGMASSTFQETNIPQPTEFPLALKNLDDKNSIISYISPTSNNSHSDSDEEIIDLTAQHNPIFHHSFNSKDSHKNTILANHLIAKEDIERHIAIEDQLLAQQTSLSLLSFSPSPAPRSKPISSVY